jgi:acetoin utilization protein AcuB
MNIPAPQVQEYMSLDVQTIGDEQTMLMAHRLMRQARVEHLPVLRQTKLVGILSDRDLNLIETLSDADPKLVLVSDAMIGDPYVVAPDAPLADVASTMSLKKLKCAVVSEHHKVVGLFTTADACAALAALLSAPAPKGSVAAP